MNRNFVPAASLQPLQGWHDALHPPPEVLPSLCQKVCDSTKEIKQQKHIQHSRGAPASQRGGPAQLPRCSLRKVLPGQQWPSAPAGPKSARKVAAACPRRCPGLQNGLSPVPEIRVRCLHRQPGLPGGALGAAEGHGGLPPGLQLLPGGGPGEGGAPQKRPSRSRPHRSIQELLGIKELSRPDYGDAVVCQPGDVPVFWPSQLTSLEAVSSCKAPLAFASTPGSTVMTDLKDTKAPDSLLSPERTPEVHRISQDPLHYSVASASAVRKVRELEAMISLDPGNRGIGHLLCKDELLRASLSLSHARSVLITTGFPTHFNHEPPEETDGPPGAIALAAFLQALEKEVSMTVDQRAVNLHRKLVEDAVEQGVLKAEIPILTYQGGSVEAAQAFLCKDGNPKSPRFDHLVAIERAGRAADGGYYNARKVNIQHLVDPIDDLFLAAKKIPGISSTGVGDGGNELGMGKVKAAVKRHIRNGDVIACDVEADCAVVAGVSNWGGYALACALYVLNSCEVHGRYLRKAVGPSRAPGDQSWTRALPSVTKEEKMLRILVRHKVRSGVSGVVGMEVDGLPFHGTHAEMIQKLVDVTTLRG
nr:UPF0317 protein C14orf159 homolog, mitochondrial isoform X3 [Microcebus murinus]